MHKFYISKKTYNQIVTKARNHLILETDYDTVLKVGELIELKAQDMKEIRLMPNLVDQVDDKNPRLSVIGFKDFVILDRSE